MATKPVSVSLTALAAIITLDKLGERVDQAAIQVRWAIDQVRADWNGLERDGGQREGHAAALLGRVRVPLLTLERLAKRVGEQIEAIEQARGT